MKVTDTPIEDVEYVEVIDDSKEVKTEPEQIWTKPFRKRFNLSITPFKRKNKKIRRNEKCECGSGLKYKKCCLNKNKEQ